MDNAFERVNQHQIFTLQQAMNDATRLGNGESSSSVLRTFSDLQTSTSGLTDKLDELEQGIERLGEGAEEAVARIRDGIGGLLDEVDQLAKVNVRMVNREVISADLEAMRGELGALGATANDVITALANLPSTSEGAAALIVPLRAVIDAVVVARQGMADATSGLADLGRMARETSAAGEEAGRAAAGARAGLGDLEGEIGDASQRIGAAGAGLDSVIDDVITSAEGSSATLRLLVEQINGTAKTMQRAKTMTEQYFRDVATVQARDALQVVADAVAAADQVRRNVSDTDGAAATDQLIASATEQILLISQRVTEELNRVAADVAAKSLSYTDQSAALTGAKGFAEEMIGQLEYQRELMEQSGSEVLERMTAPMLEAVQRIHTSMDDVSRSINQRIQETISGGAARLEQLERDLADPTSQVARTTGAKIAVERSSAAVGNVGAAGGHLEKAIQRVMFPTASTGPLYQRLAGNFTTDGKAAFLDSLKDARRANVALLQGDGKGGGMNELLGQLRQAQNGGDLDQVQGIITALVKGAIQNAGAHGRAGEQLNLHRGQYQRMSKDDQATVDAFLESTRESASALEALIRAVEEVSPDNDDALDQLRSARAELTEMHRTISDAKEKSPTIVDAAKRVKSSLSSVTGMMGTGLGLMGLGMLAPTLGNLLGAVGKGFSSYADDGRRHYRMAMTEAYLGNDVNVGRSNYMVNDLARYMHGISNGMIGFDQTVDTYGQLARTVGGHYGGTGEEAARDMAQLTPLAIEMKTVYNLSDSEVGQYMKTFYKDMRLSAQEAAGSMVSLTQAAQAANVPVGKYLGLVTQTAASLRDQGVDARQTQATMNALLATGMRMEDAQGMMQGMGRAQANMANDWNQSAFWGMMAGQGGDPFGNVLTGLLSHDANGNTNPEYYGLMAQRVVKQNEWMSALGGGPGNAMGAAMMLQNWKDQGFNQMQASQLTDAAMKGDDSILQALLIRFDEENADHEKKVAQEMTKLEGAINNASEQLAETTKISADFERHMKELGESIRDNLTGPLSKLREGVDNLLQTVVTKLDEFMKGLHDFLSTGIGKDGLDFAAENPIKALAGLLLAGGLAHALASKLKGAVINGIKGLAGGILGRLVSFTAPRGSLPPTSTPPASGPGLRYGAGSGSTGSPGGSPGGGPSGGPGGGGPGNAGWWARNGATVKRMGKYGAVAALVGGGAYAAYEYLKGDDGKDDADAKYLAEMFRTGEAKARITPAGQPVSSRPRPGERPVYDPGGQAPGAQQPGGQPGQPPVVSTEASDGYDGANTRLADVTAVTDDGAWTMSDTMMAGGHLLGNYLIFGSHGADVNAALRSGGAIQGIRSAARGFGAIGAGLSAGLSAVNEYAYAQDPRDPFSTGEHVLRAAIDTVGGVGGSVLGAVVGSAILPGVGTAVGATGGGYIGAKAADKIKDLMGLSDDRVTDALRYYDQAAKDTQETYDESRDRLMNSNTERGRLMEQELSKHGMHMKDLTDQQMRDLVDLFNRLKTSGASLQEATAFAANVADETSKLTEEKAAEWLKSASHEDRKTAMYGMWDKEEDKIQSTGVNWKSVYNTGWEVETANGTTKEEKLNDRSRHYVNKLMLMWHRSRGKKDASGRELGEGERMLELRDWIKANFVDGAGGEAISNSKAENIARHVIQGYDFAISNGAELTENSTFWGRNARTGQSNEAAEWANTELNKAISATYEFTNQKAARYAVHDDVKAAVEAKHNVAAPRTAGADQLQAQAGGQPTSPYGPYLYGEGQYWQRWGNPDIEGISPRAQRALSDASKAFAEYNKARGREDINMYITSGLRDWGGHVSGEKFDMWWDGIHDDKEGRNWLAEWFKARGAAANDEVEHPSANSTGDHFDIDASGKQWIFEEDYGGYRMDGSTVPGATLPSATPQGGTTTAAAPTTTPEPTTPEEALGQSLGMGKSGLSQMTSWLQQQKGANGNLMNDRIATGQLVFGSATTALQDRGIMMNYRGVRDDLYRYSGIQDFDRWGYGVNGAFAWEDGKFVTKGFSGMKARAEFDRKANKTYVNWLDEHKDALDAATKDLEERDATHVANERRYDEFKGNNAKDRTNCQIFINALPGQVDEKDLYTKYAQLQGRLANMQAFINRKFGQGFTNLRG